MTPPSLATRLRENLGQVVLGKSEELDLVLVALLAGGHVLLEDVPGVGKTLAARTLARSLEATFRRVQFTPDLLPTDITGVAVVDERDRSFVFRPGPVFTHILLADELNRATPRTQSALLEAMEERQVTVDGVTHPLPEPFFVIATQNPVEQQGVYDLPEAQLDRFLLHIKFGYPAADVEAQIIRGQLLQSPLERTGPVASVADILHAQRDVRNVHVDNTVIDYAVALAAATRDHAEVELGVSPRGAVALVRAAQAATWLDGGTFVLPDTVKRLVPPVFRHRMVLRPHAILAGRSASDLASEIAGRTPLPLLASNEE